MARTPTCRADSDSFSATEANNVVHRETLFGKLVETKVEQTGKRNQD